MERFQSTVRELARDLEGVTIRGDDSTPIRSIAFDSRRVDDGGLFVALRGSYTDGHDYLPEALARGAAACLVDRDAPGIDPGGYRAVVSVPDSRAALATVATSFYQNPSAGLRLIGVTGTDGKTTTAVMLDHILRTAGRQTGLISTVAVRIGGEPERSPGRQTTPESLEVQRLLAEMRCNAVDVAILETSSHGLETHRVDGCLFDIGIVTNVTHEHLDFHGTIERYRAAKAGLLERVSTAKDAGKLGVTVINLDDPGARSLSNLTGNTNVIRYGLRGQRDLDATAYDIEPDLGGYGFQLRIGGTTVAARLPLLGEWNVSNALAATSACAALGVAPETIAAALRTMRAVPGRMQSIDAGQPFGVVVDYAHTGPALAIVLDAARQVCTGKVLVVFGSAGERDIEKRSEMGAVAAGKADYAILTSEDPRFEDPESILDAIAAGASMAGSIEGVDFDRIEDRAIAIETALQKARPGDIVVLAGKGHERSIIYGAEARPWHEAAVAIDVLEQMGYARHE